MFAIAGFNSPLASFSLWSQLIFGKKTCQLPAHAHNFSVTPDVVSALQTGMDRAEASRAPDKTLLFESANQITLKRPLSCCVIWHRVAI